MEKSKFNKKWAYPLGIIIVVFSIIGLISAFSFAVSSVVKIADKTDVEKKNYEQFILPVIMNSPDTFDDITKANMKQLLDSSIWSILIKGLDTGKYKTENDKIVIPDADVDAAFAKLFGVEIKPSHQTISGGSYAFEYDASAKNYKIPITGVEPLYTPKILEITKKSSSIILTVGYLSGSDWSYDKEGNVKVPDPSKYVKITLRKKDKNTYYVSAIQNTDAPKNVKK